MRITAKEKIEAALHKSGGKEVSFIKRWNAGKLENTTIKSHEREVESKPYEFKTKATLHTHPSRDLEWMPIERRQEKHDLLKINCLPSIPDLYRFFKHLSQVPEANTPYMHIAVSNGAEVTGYTTLYATKKLIYNSIFNQEFAEKERIHFSNETLHSKESLLGYFDYLKSMGLKIRYKPMQGYKVEDGVFVKK